jgi:hypothetical protein
MNYLSVYTVPFHLHLSTKALSVLREVASVLLLILTLSSVFSHQLAPTHSDSAMPTRDSTIPEYDRSTGPFDGA